MRHNVTHLIRGEARKAHEDLTSNLVKKFDGFPFHNHIAPHLTFKRWFEMDDVGMNMLYKSLDEFAGSHKQSDYSLSGFGHFGKDVIYMDVVPSPEMSQSVLELMDVLHRIEELKFDEFDNGSDFHATVAFNALKPFDYAQIWDYLASINQPDFKMKFDNIAVMKRGKDKWEIDRVWEIKL